MTHMMNIRTLALVAGASLVAAVACKDSTGVGDLNNAASTTLDAGLTRPLNALLVRGLLNSTRGDASTDFRPLVFAQTMGRDFYRLDNAENRYIKELVGDFAPDPSDFIGGGGFTQFYVTIRAGNTIINALPTATGLSAQEVSATAGLVNLLKANAYYRALELRDSLGIAVDVNHPITDPPAVFVCKPNALTFISLLLDTASTQLAAGGAEFPFPMPSGFSLHGDFTTPAAVREVAQGLKGKVELYRGLSHQKPNPTSFAAAITAINNSFADPAASMVLGVYNTYSTAAGETQNGLADANIYLNPSVGDEVLPGDKRAAKIFAVTPKTLNGVTGRYKTTLTDPSSGLTNPIPILKNSELLLLRAQAKIESGDLVGATADINAVRVADGGLAPIAVPATKAAAITAVLYEKRYSLLGESAQRLVDLRAYGRLNAAAGIGAPGDIFQSVLPIPKTQLDARGVTSITPECP
jgi:starch-binding outer membrane protein, SusD/RagB family